MKALDVYKPPFTCDGCYIWSADGVMTLMDASDYVNSEEVLAKLCAVLNGEDSPNRKNEFTYDAPDISCNGRLMWVVRGWGHLTGTGGLHLSAEEASAIQDEFAQWVIEKLNNVCE